MESKETKAQMALNKLLCDHGEGLSILWNYGDGDGGAIFQDMRCYLSRRNLLRQYSPSTKFKKKPIPQKLRVTVFERDAYRCVKCGSYKDLSADHIHPESLGGKAELENLQTLCRPCNTRKGSTHESNFPEFPGNSNQAKRE